MEKQTEYGYINEVGMVFIPKSMQKTSNFKSYDNENVIHGYFHLKEDNLILSTIKDDAQKGYTIDEFGRILIPSDLRNSMNLYNYNILCLTLIDKDTIELKKLEVTN